MRAGLVCLPSHRSIANTPATHQPVRNASTYPTGLRPSPGGCEERAAPNQLPELAINDYEVDLVPVLRPEDFDGEVPDDGAVDEYVVVATSGEVIRRTAFVRRKRSGGLDH